MQVPSVGVTAVVFVFVPLVVGTLVGVTAVVFVEDNWTVEIGFTAGLLSNVTPFKKKVI